MGNASGVMQGRMDFGLTPLGQRQAAATAERLRKEPIHRVLTSPLKRAVTTAEAIATALGLPVEPEPGLMEYDIGEVSGLTGPELRERYPEVTAAWSRGERPRFPGEEGRDVFGARVAAVLETLRSREETVVAVAHGGVNQAVCRLVLGLEVAAIGRGGFSVANCSITEIVRDRTGGLVLLRHNDVCHLDGVATEVDRG